MGAPDQAWPEVLVDGERPSADALTLLAVVNDGHFTAAQVRAGAVRGLALHLQRLAAQHSGLYGEPLDTDRVRARMRRAVAERPDAYLRVVVRPDGSVTTVVRPPVEPNAAPQSLLPVVYERPFAHVKHVGTFGAIHHARLAERAGYDDALLVAHDGRIAESSVANLGFVDRDGVVVWPDAPALAGITWQLLERALPAAGIPTLRRPITVGSAASYEAAFLTNSIGVTPVGRIGELAFVADHPVIARIREVYAGLPWDRL